MLQASMTAFANEVEMVMMVEMVVMACQATLEYQEGMAGKERKERKGTPTLVLRARVVFKALLVHLVQAQVGLCTLVGDEQLVLIHQEQN